jgi:hypothetical protein
MGNISRSGLYHVQVNVRSITLPSQGWLLLWGLNLLVALQLFPAWPLFLENNRGLGNDTEEYW